MGLLVAVRQWYMQATLDHGWSRNILQMQIESGAHARQGKATSNFVLRLPSPQSDLVQQALKDPYLFDFLTLHEEAIERDLETGLVDQTAPIFGTVGPGDTTQLIVPASRASSTYASTGIWCADRPLQLLLITTS